MCALVMLENLCQEFMAQRPVGHVNEEISDVEGYHNLNNVYVCASSLA